MTRFFLFLSAVAVLYLGGFIYDEVGPVLYAVLLTIVASTPLLLKMSFWKKLVFMVPLVVLRVIGKVLLSVFGKNALSKLLAKYGLLEDRFNRTVLAFEQSKNQGIARWKNTQRSTQAYLLLIFFPVALLISLLTLLIKIVRLRFLQFIIEKLMQNFVMKWTVNRQAGSKADDARSTDADVQAGLSETVNVECDNAKGGLSNSGKADSEDSAD